MAQMEADCDDVKSVTMSDDEEEEIDVVDTSTSTTTPSEHKSPLTRKLQRTPKCAR